MTEDRLKRRLNNAQVDVPKPTNSGTIIQFRVQAVKGDITSTIALCHTEEQAENCIRDFAPDGEIMKETLEGEEAEVLRRIRMGRK